jgi:hypothetical protein
MAGAACMVRTTTFVMIRSRMTGSARLNVSQSGHQACATAHKPTHGCRIKLSMPLRTLLVGPKIPRVLPRSRPSSGGIGSGLGLSGGKLSFLICCICILSPPSCLAVLSSLLSERLLLSSSSPSASLNLVMPLSFSLPMILTTLTLALRMVLETERNVELRPN